MFCPSCGKENANTAVFCNGCGKSLPAPIAAAPVATPAPAPAPQQAQATPAPAPVTPPGPSFTAPAPPFQQRPPIVGPPPTTVAKRRSPVAAIVLVIILIGGIGTFAYLRIIDNEPTDKRIQRLVREAAGQQPIKKKFFARNQKLDDTLRETFSRLFQINRDYMAQAKNADLSAISKLGTAESFADPSTVDDALRQLHSLYDMDMAQEQKVQGVISDLRHIIETADFSETEKQEAVKDFDQGIAAPMERRQTAVASEQAWMQSVDDVYGYASSNHAQFILNNGQLMITDNDVLQTFNSKVQNMNARRTEFIQQQQAFSKYQGDLFQKMGIDPKDAGMQ